jgi:micrococcal nuclease
MNWLHTLALALMTTAPPAGGIVARVVDGDTMDVWTGARLVRVRLLGVDCPETRHPVRGRERFGIEAKEFTRSVVEGRAVAMEYDPHQQADRYGRVVGYVWYGPNFVRQLNLDLVERGLAFAWPYVAHEWEHHYGKAENTARQAGRGLWEGLMDP